VCCYVYVLACCVCVCGGYCVLLCVCVCDSVSLLCLCLCFSDVVVVVVVVVFVASFGDAKRVFTRVLELAQCMGQTCGAIVYRFVATAVCLSLHRSPLHWRPVASTSRKTRPTSERIVLRSRCTTCIRVSCKCLGVCVQLVQVPHMLFRVC
jgi:hypothetical protein